MSTHFHALVPYGLQREPGLIICSYAGHVRFWDSIGMGLAGGENFSSYALPIPEEEIVTTLTRADVRKLPVYSEVDKLKRLVSLATDICCINICREVIPPYHDIVGWQVPPVNTCLQSAHISPLVDETTSGVLVYPRITAAAGEYQRSRSL